VTSVTFFVWSWQRQGEENMRVKKQRQRSGQVLVIAVLVVSLVLLSTQLYIYEVGRSLEETKSIQVSDFVLAVKLGSEHMVAGSLANISSGGDVLVLSANLERWASFVEGLYQFGRPILDFTPRNTLPYVNGTRLSWGTYAFGVTSAFADFNFSLSDSQVNAQLSHAVNVTTSLLVEAFYRRVDILTTEVNVTCIVLNEGEPALAGNVTVLYERLGSWFHADANEIYSFTDYGNGTYLVSLRESYLPLETINVSAQVHDSRGIYVQVNTTCTEIS
jgi:hypothetical protein